MHPEPNSMPSELELSADSQPTVAGQRIDGGFVAQSGGRVERLVISTLCQPIARRIPAGVHPNTISVITHMICWATAALAVLSTHMASPLRSLALAGAGAAMLASMIGDCLDGMHARRTGQTSKLGEMMDHWLDTLVVPLVAVGMSFAVEMPPWGIAATCITAAMVYHAQLVLYHHTGDFLHPDTTTGVEAQLGISIGYVALAIFFYFVDPADPWVRKGVAALAISATVVQLRINGFYFARLGRWIGPVLNFAAMGLAAGGLLLAGAMDIHAFALLIVFISFRVCGSYVLFTIVGKPFGGNDWGLWALLAMMAGSHVWSSPIDAGAGIALDMLPWLTCAYVALRNAIDFQKHYAQLAPKDAA